MKFSLKHPLVRFLGVAIVLYLGWYVLYEFYLHPKSRWTEKVQVERVLNNGEVMLTDSLIYNERLDDKVNTNLKFLSTEGLMLLGYELIPDYTDDPQYRTIGIDGTHGLWIGDDCNGLKLFALFAAVIIAFPGPWKKKLWFVPLGIVAIHLINVLRLMGLAILILYAPESLDFNHNVTFTVIVYSFIFLLWYIWAKRFAGLKLQTPDNA